MRKERIFILGLLILLFSVSDVFGQNRVILDTKSKSVAFSSNKKLWGLEIAGKKILREQYKTIEFKNGLFKLENTNGQWNVCDKYGTLKLRNWIKAKDVKITDTFVLFEEADGKMAIIYHRATWQPVNAKPITPEEVYKKAEAVNANKGTSFNPTTIQQKIAMEQAEAVSAKIPFGAFNFIINSDGKQTLLVDNKELFTADSFGLFLDPAIFISSMTDNYSEKRLNATVEKNVDFYKKSGRWVFRVGMVNKLHREDYGLYILDIDLKDGKKVVIGKLSIPCKYFGIWHDTNSGYVKCELGGFKGEEYRNFSGILIDN